MKKIIVMISIISLLTACSTPMLKRQSTTQIGKTVKEGNAKYRNAEIGHSARVFAELQKKDSGNVFEIRIPVTYTETMSSLPKKLPASLDSYYTGDYFNNKSEIGGLIAQSNLEESEEVFIYPKDKELVLNTTYENICHNFASMLISPRVLFAIIASPFGIYGCLTRQEDFDSHKSWKLQMPDSFIELNNKNLGISINMTYFPNELYMSCEKKDCMVVDKNNRPVNRIYIHKERKVDLKRINELLVQERKAKEAAAKKEREEAAARQKWYKEADAVCPSLIQQVQYMQYNPYAYDIKTRKGIISSYQEYNCAEYASIIMSDL